jgi:hypothetical protein
MSKQSLARTLIVLSALLVLGGCKKDADDAKDATAADPVSLIEQGAEPREKLRYEIAEGTTTTSNMDFRIVSLATTAEGAALSVVPGVRLQFVSGPAMKAKGGNTRYDVRIINSEPLYAEGEVPEELELDLRQGAAVLNNVGGWAEVTDRGQAVAMDLNDAAKRADIPVRLLVMLINARTTLARVLLPADKVGVGAQWQARKNLTLFGFEIQQTDTYTLLSKVGNELKLRVDTVQNAVPQTLSFTDEGVEIQLESFALRSSGEIVTNLNALGANAQASGESTGQIVVKTVQSAERVEIDRAFEMEITNTVAKPEQVAPVGAAAEGN